MLFIQTNCTYNSFFPQQMHQLNHRNLQFKKYNSESVQTYYILNTSNERYELIITFGFVWGFSHYFSINQFRLYTPTRLHRNPLKLR